MVRMEKLKSRKEWMGRRGSYIGGSEAAAVVGNNPYMSNIDLWRIKTGRQKAEDISDKDYVKYGTKAEKYLRELFALDYPQYEVGYTANNIWFNDKYPYAHASLDGWLTEKETGRRGIFECKTTNILQSIQKEKWNHRIPDNYYCQIIHYLAVTEFDFAILKAQLKYEYDGDIFLNTKHYIIERADVEDDITYLMQREETFHQYIIEDREPPMILNI
ncbi:MAG: YqaJ viral recombinase family protein [Clostridia bacterium]|nr:YqaJ viral recombinase family protein [Clostridia bacterium]